MADRRRNNGPPGGTSAPVFAVAVNGGQELLSQRPARTRGPDEMRKIFLQTGITPTASGSAYLELQPTAPTPAALRFLPPASALKVSCAIHGPKPLPRSAPFSSQLVLTAHVKFAPFATRQRRGYQRDAVERDLSSHLETALRGVIIGDRWPKSGVDVVITILEGEEDRWWGEDFVGSAPGAVAGSWGAMNVVGGCITVASAALADAGIDCVELAVGGVAAMLRSSDTKGKGKQSQADGDEKIVLDPSFPEHSDVVAACVVGYLPERDEITEIWLAGDARSSAEKLMNRAAEAAVASNTVLLAAVRDAAKARFPDLEKGEGKKGDEMMTG